MLTFILITLGAFLVYFIFTWFYQRKIVKMLSEQEFIEGYRKAQLIDVREKQDFDNGHILGARNIPLNQLKTRLIELRKDKPVYLYCFNGGRSGRAAQILYKQGYREIYMLNGGFKTWTGKVKKK